MELAGSLGKSPVKVEEAPGFVVNRILIPMINEAVGILADGVAEAEDIDKAMKLGANFPMGPLALGDLIGLDVCLAIMETFTGNTAKTSTVRTVYLRQDGPRRQAWEKDRRRILRVLKILIKKNGKDRTSENRGSVFFEGELMKQAIRDKNSLKLFRNY